jgi:RNA polymerase sigma-70 factor (family 1)
MHQPFPPDESQAIASLRLGDREAFRRLYDLYWEKLYVVAYRRLRDREVAEELVQNVFTNLWVRREKLAIEKSLSAYLGSSLKYEVLNHLRAQAVRERYAQEHAPPEGVEFTQQQLSFEELYERMNREINKLPEKCRLVFTLSRMEGYSNQEIADELDISTKTVEAHMSKALKSLRTGLGEYLPVLLVLLNTCPAAFSGWHEPGTGAFGCFACPTPSPHAELRHPLPATTSIPAVLPTGRRFENPSAKGFARHFAG